MGSLKRKVVLDIALQEGLHCLLVELFNPTNIMKEILSYYLYKKKVIQMITMVL
jgi:hypothetical protein